MNLKVSGYLTQLREREGDLLIVKEQYAAVQNLYVEVYHDCERRAPLPVSDNHSSPHIASPSMTQVPAAAGRLEAEAREGKPADEGGDEQEAA